MFMECAQDKSMWECLNHNWAALREKVPNVLSRCQTKRRMGARGRAHPSFQSFGMTPTFQKKKKKKSKFFKKNFFQKILKSRCHTKRRAHAAPRARPSFGMTTTQAVRDLFAWHSPAGVVVWSWPWRTAVLSCCLSWCCAPVIKRKSTGYMQNMKQRNTIVHQRIKILFP